MMMTPRRAVIAAFAVGLASATLLPAAGPLQRPAPMRAASNAAAPAVLLAPVTDDAGRHLARLDIDAFRRATPGRVVQLGLPDGRHLRGTVAHHRRTSSTGLVVRGRLDGPPGHLGGTFILALRGADLAGLVHDGAGAAYALRSGPRGRVTLEPVDLAAPFDCAPLDVPPPPGGGGDDGGGGGTSGGCDDGSVIDLLVVYTPAARDQAGGTGSILAQIDVMVAQVNEAYESSGVSTSLNLVYASEVEYTETNGNLVQLTNPSDGLMDGVHALRDAYGADVVTLVRSGSGGAAWGMMNLSPSFESSAFNEVGLSSAALAAMAHEIGHNQGCCHAIGDSGCAPGGGMLYDFSSGHRFNGSSGTLYRTVMSYSPGLRVLRFSNPAVSYDGAPTGVPVDEEGEAENALTINSSAYTVSNFRCRDTTCSDLELPSAGNDDCNENGVPDPCDIALGWSGDVDADGVPDECQSPPCPGDFDGTGVVDIKDVFALLSAWGTGDPAYDLAPPGGDGAIDVEDLQAVLVAWGVCE